MHKIGLLTSGGDAPGMNAAIRAVVRASAGWNIPVVGFRRGFQGLCEGDYWALTPRDVANIIQRGGTILKSGRSPTFLTPQGRQKAVEVLKSLNVTGLIVIGGDGSFRGAEIFQKESGIPVVGIPGTIDNDIPGTDFTVGFDTAVSTIVQAVDRVRDTADSHDRLFIIEVMGRRTPFLALQSAVACGAEDVVVPGLHDDFSRVLWRVQSAQQRGKRSSIILVTEDNQPGLSYKLAEFLQNQGIPEVKVLILGHQQRGGSPSPWDRWLASKMGVLATEWLIQGKSGVFVAYQKGNWVAVSFEEVQNVTKPMDWELLDLCYRLAL